MKKLLLLLLIFPLFVACSDETEEEKRNKRFESILKDRWEDDVDMLTIDNFRNHQELYIDIEEWEPYNILKDMATSAELELQKAIEENNTEKIEKSKDNLDAINEHITMLKSLYILPIYSVDFDTFTQGRYGTTVTSYFNKNYTLLY